MAELSIEISDELKEQAEESGVTIAMLVKRLIKHLAEEEEMIDWSVKLQRASRYGRYDELKERGLI